MVAKKYRCAHAWAWPGSDSRCIPLVSNNPNPSYYGFANQRSWLGIPNFPSVASNLPFLLVGTAGMAFTWGAAKGNFIDARERWLYFWFVRVFLTGFGSTYYLLAEQ